MTTAQVVETSVTVNDNSPIQDYVNPDDQTQPTFQIVYVALINTADQERLHVHSDVNESLVSFVSSVFDLKFRILSNTFAIPIFGLKPNEV